MAGSALAQTCYNSEVDPNPGVVSLKLPNPFANVKTRAQWECRQEAIREQFETYELGDFPSKPDSVKGTLIDAKTLSVTVTVKDKTVAFNATISLPETNNGPYPAIIAVGGASIPIPTTVARVNFNNDQWASQTGTSARGKGLFYDLHGNNSTAGAMIAWAWGVGRLIDALEQVYAGEKNYQGINAKKLGVTGCSRNGKGAFVVGAFEKRISLTIPQESGTGGAGCWRVAASEEFKFAKNIQTLHQIVQENTWFTENFRGFGFQTVRLPIDHHMLAGLVAPRGLFVLENDIDWLGPVSTTVCMKAGRLIYKAVGVPNNMGFSLTTGHSHCQFPESDAAALNAYIDYFLLDKTFSLPEVEKSTAEVDMSEWVDWSGPAAGALFRK